MVAAVQAADGDLVAVHRTFLDRAGCGKAPVEPDKMSFGPIKGAAIRLDDAGAELAIGEDIETSSAAGLMLGLLAWSAVACGNLARHLALPPKV
jgi:hypothetical protein